jgi:predicted metal-dependent enzyme (double-stranded beta helix superfamily)
MTMLDPYNREDPEQVPFRQFIAGLRKAWAQEKDVESRMKRAQILLEELVREPALQEASRAWPSTEPHKNLVLYEDPEHGFIVNAVVRTAGRKGGVHDHAHSWTAYGVLDGLEKLERYDRLDDGSKPDYADVRLVSVRDGTPGTVDLVPPFAVHSEKGGPARSVAVIIRSERLVGRVLQGRYDPETKKYYQGDGPTQVPYPIL